MRQEQFDPRRSVTITLLIVLACVFVLQVILNRFTEFGTVRYLGLSSTGLRHGYIWQLFTYQLLHGGFLHLIFNCWAIYVFGHDVEHSLGTRRFLILYFGSGILGGLCQLLFGLTLPSRFSGPVVGASAAAFGLAAAYARLFPDRILLLFFIIPMRAKYLLVLTALLAMLGMLSPGDGIAHAAHLGGLVTGLVLVQSGLEWDWGWLRFLGSGSRSSSTRSHEPGFSKSPWRNTATRDLNDLPPEEFLAKEVDPILDKISAEGIQSLTERERRILQAARDKMAKR